MIDLEGGNQPAYNEDRSIALVFNGEFYNFQPWIKYLSNHGHQFYSESDTETLVHLYEEFGMDFLSRVRGMFSIAIHDSRRREFILARDRFGVKPLYYGRTDRGIVFASELKAFLGDFPMELDPQGMASYLTNRLAVTPFTLLKGFNKLPPGSYAVIHGEELIEGRFWALKPAIVVEGESQSDRIVLHLLEESVRLRLVSDVPLGVFLSGGIDSAAVAVLAAPEIAGPLQTFTVGFGTPLDEFEPARIVAELVRSDHHTITVDEQDALKLLAPLTEMLDEPNSDPATLPTYALSKLARPYVKGVLLGEGSDEIFGGYEQYRVLRALRLLQVLTSRRHIGSMAMRIGGKLRLPSSQFIKLMGTPGINRISTAIGNPVWDTGYMSLVGVFDQKELEFLGFATETPQPTRPEAAVDRRADSTYRAQLFDINYLLPALLDRVDKATMANSLEGREPFLDHVLAEYVLGLDPRRRVDLWTGKIALRRALGSVLPRSVRSRPKQRFYVPIDRWFMGEMGELYETLMDTSEVHMACDGYFSGLPARLREAPLYYARQMWSRLVLELWYRKFVLSEVPRTTGLPSA